MHDSQSKIRCSWVPANNQLYQKYHDLEWGVPIHDDNKLFEFLVLEGAQAGLSWETILKRRPEYQKAFANFDVARVAKFDEEKIKELLQNPGIIRNKLKIKSAISNARAFLKVQAEFGSFNNYIWKFVNYTPITNRWKNAKDIPTKTRLAEKISQDLKQRGFSFVGPIIIYAFMQAIGLVNDHTLNCFCYRKLLT